MESQSNKVIVFDFNRTLYNPDRRKLINGATGLLELALSRGYRLILLGQAAVSREQLVGNLGLSKYFEEIILVEQKTAQIFETLAQRYDVDKAGSYVIGDRAQREILLGYQAGWGTIWLRAGKFASELPAANHPPTHTVATLAQIHNLI